MRSYFITVFLEHPFPCLFTTLLKPLDVFPVYNLYCSYNSENPSLVSLLPYNIFFSHLSRLLLQTRLSYNIFYSPPTDVAVSKRASLPLSLSAGFPTQVHWPAPAFTAGQAACTVLQCSAVHCTAVRPALYCSAVHCRPGCTVVQYSV